MKRSPCLEEGFKTKSCFLVNLIFIFKWWGWGERIFTHLWLDDVFQIHSTDSCLRKGIKYGQFARICGGQRPPLLHYKFIHDDSPAMGKFFCKYRSTTIYFFACLNLGFFSNFPFLLSSFLLYSFLGCINLCLLSIFPFTSCFSPFLLFFSFPLCTL